MNKSKKLTAVVAATAAASALVAPAAFASGTQLNDIDGSYAKDAIQALVDKGIINGKGDGKFDPTGKIERQDFAIILAKALNLDVTAAPATATFSDVPTTDYSFKYVEAAAKAGLIKGVGNGEFGAGQNLSREDMAVLFVRALGIDATGKGASLTFSDKDSISDYAKDAVAAAVELKLISGNGDGSFNPAGNAERQAVALVASKFIEAKAAMETAQLSGAVVVDNNTVTLTFSKELDKLDAADVAIAAKATGAAVTVSTATLSADKKSATVKLSSALANGTTYTATVAGKTVEFTTAAKAEVSAVTALNLKQVKVEFSGEINSDAVVAANFVFTGDSAVTAAKAELQADNKTVIVTLADGAMFNQQGAYTLTVNSQVGKDGTAIDSTSKDFTTFDNTVPTAKDVTVTGPNTLKLTFSSPMAVATNANFSLDNGSVSVTVPSGKADINGTVYSVTLNVGADLAEGTHTLKVTGAAGFNGLKIADQSLSFNFVKDTTAPTITKATAKLTSTTTSSAQLTFSEPVALDAVNSEIFAIYNGLPSYKGTASVDADATQFIQNGVVYADTFDVDFGVVLPTGTVNFFINNMDEDDSTLKIVDAWGNEFASTTAAATITVDNVKPTVSVVKANSQTEVAVQFSEDVLEATAETQANFTFYKADGTTLVTGTGFDGGHPIAPPVYDMTTKTATITLPAALAGGTYKLKVANVKDIAVPAQNTMDAATITFAVSDTSNPAVDSALFTSDQKTLFINFSKAMDVASISDLNNYAIAGAPFNNLPGNITATVTPINGNTGVKVTFSNTLTALADNAVLTYGHLKDATGNYTAKLSEVINIHPDKIATTDISNVKIVSADTITFEVLQPLSGINMDRFSFQGAPVGQAFYSNQKVGDGTVDGALVTVKLPRNSANTLYADINNFSDLSILAASGLAKSALVNANGNGLDGDVSFGSGDIYDVVADAIAPKVTKVESEDLSGNGRLDAVYVTFSEAMLASSVGLDTFNVAGYTVTDVQLVGGTVFKAVLKENSYTDSSNLPTVTLAKDARDAHGNIVKANSTVPATVKGF